MRPKGTPPCGARHALPPPRPHVGAGRPGLAPWAAAGRAGAGAWNGKRGVAGRKLNPVMRNAQYRIERRRDGKVGSGLCPPHRRPASRLGLARPRRLSPGSFPISPITRQRLAERRRRILFVEQKLFEAHERVEGLTKHSIADRIPAVRMQPPPDLVERRQTASGRRFKVGKQSNAGQFSVARPLWCPLSGTHGLAQLA
jgi:hypothetical protein